MLLGLTGGYCAGKNTVAAMLEKRGWFSIDVDRLGHQALELAREEVLEHFDAEARSRFNRGLLDEGGLLDRKLLGAIVFSDPRKLAEHEAIIHPVMFALVDAMIAALRAEAQRQDGTESADAEASPRAVPPDAELIVINAAILYKMPLAASCDAIIEVRAPLRLRLSRAKARDGLGLRRALDRIGRQAPLWRLRPKEMQAAREAASPAGRGIDKPSGKGRRGRRVVTIRNAGDEAKLESSLDSILALFGQAGPLLRENAKRRDPIIR